MLGEPSTWLNSIAAVVAIAGGTAAAVTSWNKRLIQRAAKGGATEEERKTSAMALDKLSRGQDSLNTEQTKQSENLKNVVIKMNEMAQDIKELRIRIDANGVEIGRLHGMAGRSQDRERGRGEVSE